MVSNGLVDLTGGPLAPKGKARNVATSYGGATLAPHEQLTVTLDSEHIAGLLAIAQRYPQPIAMGYTVLLLMIPPPDRIGSVEMSDATKERMSRGSIGAVVLHLGPDAYTGEKFKSGPWCRPGDYVLVPRYGGQQFDWFGGLRIAAFFDDQILLRMPRQGDAETDPTIIARRKAASETAGATASADGPAASVVEPGSAEE